MKLAALLLSAALAGCAGLSLTNDFYDNIEYSRYIDISTSAKMGIKQCTDAMSAGAYAETLATETEFAVRYSGAKASNKNVLAASQELQALVTELVNRYSKQAPSAGYCELKYAQISVAAATIATSIGKKEK